MSFAHASHAVDDVAYKLEWCAKYRYTLFGKPRFLAACEAAVRAVAERHRLIIVELSVVPEHVHCIVRCKRFPLRQATLTTFKATAQ